jgi:hypothetical protein
MKYLHEIMHDQDHFHDNWETRQNYLYPWTITSEQANKYTMIVPIKNIVKVYPFRGTTYGYRQEALFLDFNDVYTCYNNYTRIHSDELIKIINRKKKNQSLILKKSKRYFYAYLEGK